MRNQAAMHIKHISVKDVPPISKSISLDCDERVNLFIGPNASGKSTVLRVMDYAYRPNEEHLLSGTVIYETVIKENLVTRDAESSAARLEAAFGLDAPACFLLPSNDWPHEDAIIADRRIRLPIWNRVPLLYIPATRVNLPTNPVGWCHDEYFLKATEIARRRPDLGRLITTFGIEANNDPVIFDAQTLKEEIDALRFISHDEKNKQYQLGHALHMGYACARKICNEVVTGYSTHTYVEATDDDLVRPDDMLAHLNMGIGTSDGISGAPLYAGALSSGTQGTLSWIWAMALKMAQHYDWDEGWEKESAILLIDEVENHLHPTWQRRVIPALLEYFPKLQIFATTHSPFVVAGLKAGQVHLLKRDKDGGVTASTNSEDIVGWTMDEILRAMMGVEDPTDDATASAARELRELRKEGPRQDEQAEGRRQRRIEELRQRVNRDLLTGGPEAAQREEFEQQFSEALRRHQEFQSLDQDRG